MQGNWTGLRYETRYLKAFRYELYQQERSSVRVSDTTISSVFPLAHDRYRLQIMMARQETETYQGHSVGKIDFNVDKQLS